MFVTITLMIIGVDILNRIKLNRIYCNYDSYKLWYTIIYNFYHFFTFRCDIIESEECNTITEQKCETVPKIKCDSTEKAACTTIQVQKYYKIMIAPIFYYKLK